MYDGQSAMSGFSGTVMIYKGKLKIYIQSVSAMSKKNSRQLEIPGVIYDKLSAIKEEWGFSSESDVVIHLVILYELLMKGFGALGAAHLLPATEKRQQYEYDSDEAEASNSNSTSTDIRDKVKSILKKSLNKKFGLSDDDIEKIAECVLQRLTEKIFQLPELELETEPPKT